MGISLLIEKGKGALHKTWVQAFLIAAFLAAVIVSVYYSKDRWTSLGVVGTWAIGLFAALISYGQRKEQKQRRNILIQKNEMSIQFDCIRVSVHLIELMEFLCKRIELGEASLKDVELLRELVRRSVLWPKVNIGLLYREFIDAKKEQEIIFLNTWSEALVGRFEFFLRNDDLTIFSKRALSELVGHIERIRESVEILNPNNDMSGRFKEMSRLARQKVDLL